MINRRMTRRDFLRKAAIGAAIPFAAPAAAADAPRGKVKILELADIHVLDDKSAAYPRKVIQAMNEEGGDLVLACGDLATKGKKTELLVAKDILDGLKMPYYPVLGNHDALYSGEKDEDLFKEVFSLKGNSYHFVKKGIHFLAVDHGCGKAYGKNHVRPQVMAWIRKTLAQIPAQEPILFFSHYPFGKGVRYQTRNAAEVLALFKNKNLLAMVGAHFHGNTERVENGVLMTTTACCSGTRGNHDGTKAKGYRVFHVDEKLKVTTEFKEVRP